MRYASYSRDDGTNLYTILAGAGSDGMILRAVVKSSNSDNIIDQPHGVDIESKLLAYTVSNHPMLGPKSAFYSIADFHFDNMDESGRMHPAIFTESKRASSYSDPNNNMPPYKNEYANGKQDLSDYLASQQGQAAVTQAPSSTVLATPSLSFRALIGSCMPVCTSTMPMGSSNLITIVAK